MQKTVKGGGGKPHDRRHTEQPMERPQKGRKPYFSGKKKRHTLKTEIRITRKGRIVNVSKKHPGSTHDFTVFKGEKCPPKRVNFSSIRVIKASQTGIKTPIFLINQAKISL
jgi:hypothetical protein